MAQRPILKTKEHRVGDALEANALTGIRTPVLGLKGLRPSPLDDEGKRGDSIIGTQEGQENDAVVFPGMGVSQRIGMRRTLTAVRLLIR